MNNPTPGTFVLPAWLRPWEQFWFAPRDPSLLALVRIACGLITVYILVVYSFSLQEFMGEDGWHDMKLRNHLRYERPVVAGTHSWQRTIYPAPQSDWQRDYVVEYRKKWAFDPPPPYPEEQDLNAIRILDQFIKDHGIDLRVNGLPIPRDKFQLDFANEYTRAWKGPPPAYPKDEAERLEIVKYMEDFRADPRRLYDKGMPVWSLWFHVVDPQTMAIVHFLVIVCAILFTVGFCTRVTSALIWFASLWYIHRNPTTLFGVDTMMIILLLYLMISPCGAVFSVDALIRRWWARAKPGVVGAWCRFWKRPAPDMVAPIAPTEAEPSVAANVAIRLMQIHICIIYLMAGLSKLQGQAWWNGEALWLTLGNFEFAPMQFEIYLKFLRLLGTHQWLYHAFMTGGGLFTLVFEIAYAFLVWRPKLRWTMLGSAVLLHGFIGLFMGLQTFSFIMLVMNMAFLTPDDVRWFFRLIATPKTVTDPPAAPPMTAPAVASTSFTTKPPAPPQTVPGESAVKSSQLVNGLKAGGILVLLIVIIALVKAGCEMAVKP